MKSIISGVQGLRCFYETKHYVISFRCNIPAKVIASYKKQKQKQKQIVCSEMRFNEMSYFD